MSGSPSDTNETSDVPAASSAAPVEAPGADNPAPEGDTSGVVAESPAAKTADEGPATLQEALQQAVDPSKASDKPAAPETPVAKAEEKPAQPRSKTAEEQAAEDEKLPFGKHPRWKEMVGERNEYRAKAEALAPRAQEYDRIVDFMQQNSVTPEELRGLYMLGALMKNDPERALQTLNQMIEPLREFVGEKLPEDLQSEVDDGVITEARARELAKLRHRGAFQQEQTQRQMEQTQQEAEISLRRAQSQAVTAWEQQIAKTDPDYPKLQKWVVMELKRLAAEKPARSADDAVKLAKEAYENVSRQFRETIRGAADIPRGPSSTTSRGSNPTPPKPATMLDAVRSAV